LSADEGSELQSRPGSVLISTQSPLVLTVEGIAPILSAGTMSISVERRSTAIVTEKIEAYNFSSNAYDVVSTISVGPANSVINVPLAGPDDYIGPAGEVRVKLSYRPPGAVLIYPWNAFHDRLSWRMTPP
jgi:hypothetical protein